MKAVFEFKGVKTTIEVPIYLYHINDLTNKVAELDEAWEDEYDISEAYDYLEEELRYIFAREKQISPDELYCEFMIPSTEDEQEFGCLIKVYSDEDN